ncbi:MAG: hypothetical protein JJT85_06080 [Chromatiales bacterium]|nr:hypothetical protein [Chromatiales bacterium]
MLLVAAILALLAGPLLFRLARHRAGPMAFLDGLTLVTIVGLSVFSILPEAIAIAGPSAWVLAGLGLLFPTAVERLFTAAVHRIHMAVLVLAITGLALHAVIDGLILLGGEAGHSHSHSHGHSHGHGLGAGEHLALSVVLHNLPKGLALWYLLAPAFGTPRALGVLLLLSAATLSGYLAGDGLLAALDAPALAWFQAFVAGSILHVVLHGAGAHAHDAEETREGRQRLASRLGLVGGMLLLWLALG